MREDNAQWISKQIASSTRRYFLLSLFIDSIIFQLEYEREKKNENNIPSTRSPVARKDGKRKENTIFVLLKMCVEVFLELTKPGSRIVYAIFHFLNADIYFIISFEGWNLVKTEKWYLASDKFMVPFDAMWRVSLTYAREFNNNLDKYVIHGTASHVMRIRIRKIVVYL